MFYLLIRFVCRTNKQTWDSTEHGSTTRKMNNMAHKRGTQSVARAEDAVAHTDISKRVLLAVSIRVNGMTSKKRKKKN
jgi:hypothetical protein